MQFYIESYLDWFTFSFFATIWHQLGDIYFSYSWDILPRIYLKSENALLKYGSKEWAQLIHKSAPFWQADRIKHIPLATAAVWRILIWNYLDSEIYGTAGRNETGTIVVLWYETRLLWVFIKELRNAFKSTFFNFSYRKILGLSKEVLYVNFGAGG